MDNCPEDPYGVSSPENLMKHLRASAEPEMA